MGINKIIMTLYIVRAKPNNDLSGLRKELELSKISKLRPFGETLHHGLKNYIVVTFLVDMSNRMATSV